MRGSRTLGRRSSRQVGANVEDWRTVSELRGFRGT